MTYSERLHNVIPGGAHTYSRGDDQYPLNAPQILEKGKGAYVWDAEGNKFLDYGMALRAVTLGYANEEVNEAAINAIKSGINLTRATTIELEAAELLVDLIPSADMVKFAKNGSNVTTAAIKLARAYTNKNIIIRCSDHPFFSFDDWFISDTSLKKGIPKEVAKLTISFKYNDIESLKKCFRDNKDNIAAVILEPATSLSPKDGFLKLVKEIAHENGSLFILDEMITGFRWHLQGAQQFYDVEPDLTTFGKGMANGFSVAALMGKREIMELGGIQKEGAERVFLMSTTHGAEMPGLAALIKTIEIYKRDNVIEHLWNYGKKLIDGANEISNNLGLLDYFYMDGISCSPNYNTKNKNGEFDLAFRTLFSQEMIKNKVLIPWISLSYSHGEEELSITLKAIEKSLLVYKKAIDNGIEKYLHSPSIKPVFRKYN